MTLSARNHLKGNPDSQQPVNRDVVAASVARPRLRTTVHTRLRR
jgi:hypothetical protein